MNDLERELAATFHRETMRHAAGVTGIPRCAACGYFGAHLEADHALPVQSLRLRFRELGLALPAAVRWDVRNGRALCAEPAPNRCHNRWTNRVFGYAPPPVREAVREFARELDERYATDGAEPFQAYLDKTYGEAAS